MSKRQAPSTLMLVNPLPSTEVEGESDENDESGSKSEGDEVPIR